MTVINNSIKSNPDWTTAYAIKMMNSMNNTFYRNTIKYHSFIGLYLETSNSNNLTQNEITHNFNGNLFLSGSCNNTITENNLSVNTGYPCIGLYSGSNNNSIFKNNYTELVNDGIYIDDSDGNHISYNWVVKNGGYCIKLTSTADYNEVDHNFLFDQLSRWIQDSGTNNYIHDNIMELNVPQPPGIPPNPPILITTSCTIEYNNITVQWYAVTGATQYRIYVNGILNQSTTSTQSKVMLWNNGTYYIHVTAYNSSGESDPSSEITIIAEIPPENQGNGEEEPDDKPDDNSWIIYVIIGAVGGVGGLGGILVKKKRLISSKNRQALPNITPTTVDIATIKDNITNEKETTEDKTAETPKPTKLSNESAQPDHQKSDTITEQSQKPEDDLHYKNIASVYCGECNAVKEMTLKDSKLIETCPECGSYIQIVLNCPKCNNQFAMPILLYNLQQKTKIKCPNCSEMF